MTEIELLAGISKRDENALRELYDLYYPRLGRFLLRLTGDVDMSAEVINDVFMVVWDKAASFRGDSSPSTWIIGIAYRKALKAMKRKPMFVSIDEVPEPITTGPGSTTTLEESMAQLSPKHRAVIVLTYKFGYSYKEIGRILKCPENTVKTRMFHARKALEQLLEVGGGE